MATRRSLTTIEVREISHFALVNERTLLRALGGLPVRAMCAERIRRELGNRGLLSLLPAKER
jgi:hypothetical protein